MKYSGEFLLFWPQTWKKEEGEGKTNILFFCLSVCQDRIWKKAEFLFLVNDLWIRFFSCETTPLFPHTHSKLLGFCFPPGTWWDFFCVEKKLRHFSLLLTPAKLEKEEEEEQWKDKSFGGVFSSLSEANHRPLTLVSPPKKEKEKKLPPPRFNFVFCHASLQSLPQFFLSFSSLDKFPFFPIREKRARTDKYVCS